MANKKKFLFIYLKTGGGHFAPAKAITEYYTNHNCNAAPVLVDGLEKGGRLAKYVVEDGYRMLQSKSKWIYESIYAVHKIKFIAHLSAYLVSLFMTKHLAGQIKKENPDKIVLLHFFAIKPVYRILKKNKLDIPVVTIVTDPYIAHPLWTLRKEQTFIVFSKRLKSNFVKRGINGNNINVFPFVLSEKFSRPATEAEKTEFKKRLGFTQEKVLLILGGGDGIPGGLNILRKLMRMEIDFEAAIVCGKNKELFEEANNMKKEYGYKNLAVFGFVDFIYELINTADIVVSKCGASTFMEILISNKIPVVNNYLWEQEKGNVDFIIENNLGIYEPKVKRMRDKIRNLLKDEGLMDSYKRNIAGMNFRNGLNEVAEYLMQ